MKETLKYNKEIEFDNTISEIASISLECTYNEENRGASGVFLVEGSYKSFELFDDENFHYELPFENRIDNLKADTLNIEINDFTYEINANKLIVDIDYTVNYEEDDYLDEEELNRFLEEHEVDVVSFKEEEDLVERDVKEEECLEPFTEESEPSEEVEINEEECIEEIEEENEENKADIEEERALEETLLNNINQEEKYITYHVYVCENDDTLESVSKKFNISINEIIEYNNLEEVSYGTKLIIPANEE